MSLPANVFPSFYINSFIRGVKQNLAGRQGEVAGVLIKNVIPARDQSYVLEIVYFSTYGRVSYHLCSILNTVHMSIRDV